MTVALRDRAQTPLDASLPKLQSFVSPYTGLVRRSHEALRDTDDANFVRWDVELCDVVSLTGRGLRNGFATSVHYDRRQAQAAALGEALERYAAINLPDDLVLDTAEGLGAIAADPSAFGLFAAEQYAQVDFRYLPFTPRTPVLWTKGWRLPDCAPAMLPAQLVYLVDTVGAGETRIGYATTSGNACGPTLEEALLGGLLELVERDAFMIAWNAGLTFPRFELDDYAHRDRFDRCGLRYAAVDLSAVLGVPAAAATVRDERSGDAALAVGAAAAPSAAAAVDKAIREAFHGRSWAARMHPKRREAVARMRPQDIASFDEHVLYYCDPRRARSAAFFDGGRAGSRLRGDDDIAPGTPYRLLLRVLRRLGARGIEAFFVDLTPEDVRDAGLHVVAVVAPRLARLDVPYQHRYLGCERLYTLPAALGLAADRLTYRDLNLAPHPFP